MQYIQSVARGAASSLLISTLIIFGLAFGLIRVLGTPNDIKTALKQSGVYQTAVPNALDQAQKSQNKDQSNQPNPGGSGNQNNQIPLDKPEVRTIIQNAASPAYLQAQIEGSLDSVYSWLQGKTPTLDFNIDLTDVKARLANGMEQYAQQHLSTLPICPAGTSTTQDIDLFQATCLPKGTNINAVALDAKDKLLTGDFLKDTKITPATIKVGDNGQTLDQKLRDVPKIYKGVVRLTYGLGILAVLLCVALVFLGKTRRSGGKRVASLAIVCGSIVMLIGLGLSFGLHKAATKISDTQNTAQKSGIHVAQLLADDLRVWWVGYGIFLIVLGIGTLVTLRILKKRGPTAEQSQPEPVVPAAQKPAAPADKPKPKTTPAAKKLVG